MDHSKQHQLQAYHYHLPPELIAQQPLAQRDASRLLMLPRSGSPQHRSFPDLVTLLGSDDVLVLNDTRVMAARLCARKATGGQVQILIERVTGERTAHAHIHTHRKHNLPDLVWVDDVAIHLQPQQGLYEIEVSAPWTMHTLMASKGQVPLPPYIKRALTDEDAERYQTVYANQLGALAAPTAGLHWDQALLKQAKAQGVTVVSVTLHVGSGTFQPVRTASIHDHVMHRESIHISPETAEVINQAKTERKRIIAVGTTVVRALESAWVGDRLQPYQGDSQLFIYPGYRFQCIDELLTNFHLPCSTLLMLVCALGGYGSVMAAYQEAVAQRYRFFSYGDAMYLCQQERM